MRITINASPAIAGEPASLTVCAGSPASFTVAATGAGLTYQWQVSHGLGATWSNVSDTATNASYTNLVTMVGDNASRYPVIVSGACIPAVTSTPAAILTVKAVRTAQAGPNQTVCASSPAATLAGSFAGGATMATWSGAGTFAPNATTLNAVYTPTAPEVAAGTATVTLAASNPDGVCPAAISTMTITINPAATVSAGPNQTVCANNADAHLSGSFGGAASSVTWSGGAGGSFIPNAAHPVTIYRPARRQGGRQRYVDADHRRSRRTLRGGELDCDYYDQPGGDGQHGRQPTLCSSSATASLGGTVGGGATGGAWTSSGTGSFAPNTDDAQTRRIVRPQADITAGTVTLTLTTTGQLLPCAATNAQVVVTIHPAATAGAGANQTICASSSTGGLGGSVGGGATGGTWTSSGTGTFVPNTTTLNATYSPSAGDITAGTVTLTLSTSGQVGPCGATAQVLVTIRAAATAGAGGNQTICSGHSTAGLGGTVGGGATGGTWSSSGTGSFAPNATTLNATYSPSFADITAGTVTLRLTTSGQLAPCGATTTQVVVTIHPAATASAGANQTVNGSTPTTPLGGTVGGGATGGAWTSSGNGTFAPDATDLNATYAPSPDDILGGSVTLTLSTTGQLEPCGPVTAHVVVTINRVATVSTGGNQTVCAVQNHGRFGGIVGDGATGGVWTSSGTGSFVPNTTTLNATYSPSAADQTAGTVTLTLTTTGQPEGTAAGMASMVVTINTLPTANAGPNQSLTAGITTVQLAGSVGNGATGGTWSGGSGTFNPDASTLNAVYTPTAKETAAGSWPLTLTPTGPF